MPNGEVDTSFAITSAFNRIVLLQEDGRLDTTFDPGMEANDTIFAVASHPDGGASVPDRVNKSR